MFLYFCLQELVLFSLTTPIQDDVIFSVPLEIVSDILAHVSTIIMLNE